MERAEIYEIEEKFIESEKKGIERYLKKRKRQLARKIGAEGLELDTEGINAIKIQRELFEPVVEPTKSVVRYSAAEILIALEYFSYVIEQINEKTLFPPQLEQFCRLLGISTNNFKMNYLNSTDDEKRNAAQQVVDFISMTLSYGGMTRQIDNTAQIFVQKSSLGRKDNDQPVVNNNNNTIVITPEEFAKQVEKLNI